MVGFYFYNCSATEDEILESVQRRGFKIITGGIVRAPIVHLYNKVSLETLKARRDRNVLLFFFNIIIFSIRKLEKTKPGCYMFEK